MVLPHYFNGGKKRVKTGYIKNARFDIDKTGNSSGICCNCLRNNNTQKCSSVCKGVNPVCL